MTQNRVPIIKSEQRVDDAAVAHIDLWGLYQALADFGVERLQPPHQQEVDEEVEIAGNRFPIDRKATRQLRGIHDAALDVRQHGPEAAQRFSRHARPKLRNVALETCADEILPPDCAGFATISEKTVRESVSNPEVIAFPIIDFETVEWLQLHISDATSQRLARLLEQID